MTENGTSFSVMDSFANKRILITGGLGFLGTNLAYRLLKLGGNVTLVDSLIPEYGGNLFNIAASKKMSASISPTSARSHSMTYLVQGAGIICSTSPARRVTWTPWRTSVYRSWKSTAAPSSPFSRPAAHTIRASRSSSAAPARSTASPITCRCAKIICSAPSTSTASTKWRVSGTTSSTAMSYGIRACALRSHQHLRPAHARQGRPADLSRHLDPPPARRPGRCEVWGGAQLRDFSYVEDAVDAFLMAAAHPGAAGNVYNIGGCEVNLATGSGRLGWWRFTDRGNTRCERFPKTVKKLTSAITTPTTLGSAPTWDGNLAFLCVKVCSLRLPITKSICRIICESCKNHNPADGPPRRLSRPL